MNNLKYFSLAFILIALILEISWSYRKKRAIFSIYESLGNLGIFIVNQLLKPISLTWKYLIFNWISQYELFHFSVNIQTIIFTFFLTEFTYYWYHRLSHEIPLLWTLHHTHHSAKKYNLTTALRLNWLGLFVSPIFYLPLVLLGLSPEIIVSCLAFGLFYQYFLHTEAIKRLGWFEGLLFNTPSAHRVHHGSNEKYIDKNYGAMLIVFDKWFGTYEPETEQVKYGVTTGFFSNNPLVINFKPLFKFINGSWKREKQNH
jgi:sterol desaturase/sphingolipid hydroxylase (fatty acid hydroxylase superfamily)